MLTVSLFVLVGIPFLALLILGLRMLSSNVKQVSRATSLSLLGLWIIALLMIIFTAIEFGTTHANYGKNVVKKNLTISKQDTLTVKMINNDEIYYKHNLRRSSRRHEVEVDNKRMVYTNDIRIDVNKSNTNEAYVIIQKRILWQK